MSFDVVEQVVGRNDLSFCAFADALQEILAENFWFDMRNRELIDWTEENYAVNAVAHCLIGKEGTTIGVAQHLVGISEMKEV